MQKGLKIFVGIIALLGFLSVVFLYTSKEKKQPAVNIQKPQTQKVSPVAKTPVIQENRKLSDSGIESNEKSSPATISDDRKTLVRNQWQECRNKNMPSDTKLFWNVQVTEGIPVGGTYAKGYLDSDLAFAVRIILKPDSQNLDKIEEMLVADRIAYLIGKCTDVANDGSVILEVF